MNYYDNLRKKKGKKLGRRRAVESFFCSFLQVAKRSAYIYLKKIVFSRNEEPF